MSTTIKGSAARQLALGYTVVRATATTGLAGAAGDLFSITGGRIMLTSIVGELTVAAGATASTLTLTSIPSTGSNTVIASATAIASSPIGARFTLNATALGALVVTATQGAAPMGLGYGLIIPAGKITATTSADPTGGPSARWTLTYIPYDDGATVAAL